MENFNFYAPTKVVFGKGAEEQVGALVKEQNCKKVLVHFGGQNAKKSGLLDRVYASLDAAGIDYVSLGGVVPNPRLSKVREGIELCKKEGVDFLLAVGGGSVIDSCKAIGYGLANDCDVWDLYLRKIEPTGCYPVGVVLTIAAAGSEMSNSSVITNEEGWLKRSCNTDYGRCKFAIMNPELTYTLLYRHSDAHHGALLHQRRDHGIDGCHRGKPDAQRYPQRENFNERPTELRSARAGNVGEQLGAQRPDRLRLCG